MIEECLRRVPGWGRALRGGRFQIKGPTAQGFGDSKPSNEFYCKINPQTVGKYYDQIQCNIPKFNNPSKFFSACTPVEKAPPIILLFLSLTLK